VRRPTLLVAAAGVLILGGASLGLAQDNTTAPPPPPDEAPVQPVQPPANITPVEPLQIPPAEEAPPPPPEVPSKSQPATPAANTVANAVDEAPPPPPPPPRRPRYQSVVLQALDKVTAETLRFEARVNEPVRYKDLVITVHACETQASDEPYAQTAAHLEVQYQPEVIGGRTPEVARQVFRGWMFGDAPGLHPFEHPIYDVWVIACKAPSGAASPPPSAPAPGASL
jgi:hypothetical protein